MAMRKEKLEEQLKRERNSAKIRRQQIARAKEKGLISETMTTPISEVGTTRGRLGWGRTPSNFYGKEVEQEIYQNIIQGATVESNFDIRIGYNGIVTNYNPMQSVVESLEKIKGTKAGSGLYMDLEWLGGEGKLKHAPVEFGVYGFNINRGKIIHNLAGSKGQVSDGVTFAIQLEKSDVDDLTIALNKVKAGKQITEAEYRSLKDLINYSGRNAINPDGIITKAHKKASVTKHNIGKFVKEIEEGLHALDPNSDGGSNAIARVDITSKIAEVVTKNGWTLDDDTIFAWHNGYSADLPVIKNTEGFEKVATMVDKHINVDTMAILKATGSNRLDATSGNIRSPYSLSTQLGSRIPGFSFNAHKAGDDSKAGALLLEDILNTDTASLSGLIASNQSPTKIKKGGILFSNKAVNIGSPLDGVFYIDSEGIPNKLNNNYQSVWGGAEYKLNKQFQYRYGDELYYGVVLKHVDDDAVSIIARPSKEALYGALGSNFSSIPKGRRSEISRVRQSDKARVEYRKMFSTAESPTIFNRNLKATDRVLEILNDPTSKKRLRNGMPSNAILQQLIDEKILTKKQAIKFKEMFPRLKSEFDVLSDFKTNVLDLIEGENGNAWNRRDKQAIALNEFKKVMDETLGLHLEEVDIGKDMRRFAKINDPNSPNAPLHLNITSQEDLAEDIKRYVNRGASTKNANLSDVKRASRNFIWGLEDQGIIGEKESLKLASQIEKIANSHGTMGKEKAGFMNIYQQIAANIIDPLSQNPALSISDQESLASRTIKANWKELVPGAYAEISDRANHFLSGKDGKLTLPKTVAKELEGYDNFLKRYVASFSNVNDAKVLSPDSILDSLEKLTGKLSANNIAVDIRMANERGSRGLQLTLADRSTSKALTNGKSRNSASLFIPLIDPTTGHITHNNVSGINVINPTMTKNGIRINTYQNKIFSILGSTDNVQEMARLIREGRSGEVTKFANSRVTFALSGRPSTSTISMQNFGDLNASTPHANSMRQKFIDMNTYKYHYAKREGIDVRTINDTELVRRVMYGGDPNLVNQLYPSKRRENNHTANLAVEMRSQLNAAFGEDQWGLSNIKADKSGSLIFGLNSGDPRRFGLFGTYSELGRENARSALNYYEMRMDDVIDPLTGKTRNNALESISRLSDQAKQRLVGDLAIQKDYANLRSEGAITSLNLKTAFLTTDEATDLIGQNMPKGKNLHFMEAMHTYDDTMFVRSDVAELYGAVENRKIDLGFGGYLRSDLADWKPENGNIVINSGDTIGFDLNGEKIKHTGSFQMIYKGSSYDENKGLSMHVSEFRPGTESMKLAGIHGGNKATARIGSDRMFDALGEQFKDMDAIMYVNSKKMPADLIVSQLQLAVDAANQVLDSTDVTVKDIKRAEMQNQVMGIIQKGFQSSSSISPEEAARLASEGFQVSTNSSGRLVLTDRGLPNANFSVANLVSGTTSFLEGVGVSSNVINISGDPKNARNVLTGIVSMARMNVNEEYGAWGKYSYKVGKGTKVSSRELEFLRNRGKFLGGDLNINNVIKVIEDRITDDSSIFKNEIRQGFDALKYLADKSSIDSNKFGTIKLTEDGEISPGDKRFMDIKQLPTDPAGGKGLSDVDIRNTILDPKLFDGSAYFLELPEEVKVGNKTVDKILMPAMGMRGSENEIFSTEIQKKQRQIFDTIKTMNEYKNLPDNIEEDSVEAIAHSQIYRDASLRLHGDGTSKGLIEQYYNQLGDDLYKSKGLLNERSTKARMGNSARLRFATVNPLEHTLSNLEGGGLKEQSLLMSRKDFANMLGGLDDETVEEYMKKALKGEATAVGIRYPVHRPGSIQSYGIRVLSEQEELDLGMKSGKVYITVGSQIRQGADFDGDEFSVFMPQFAAGSKKQRLEVEKQMSAWQESERKMSEIIAKAKRKEWEGDSVQENVYNLAKNSESFSVLSPKFAENSPIEKLIAVESRLQKLETGSLSNLNTAYRRMASTVGGATKDSLIEDVMIYFGTAVEQTPISSKRIQENVEEMVKLLVENGGVQTDQTEALARRIEAPARLRNALYNLDREEIIAASKDLGFFDESGQFVGATKNERELYNVARQSKGFSDWDTKAGGPGLTIDMVDNTLKQMEEYYGGQRNAKNAMHSIYMQAGLGGANSTDDLIEKTYELLHPSMDMQAMIGNSAFEDVFKNIASDDVFAMMKDKAENIAVEKETRQVVFSNILSAPLDQGNVYKSIKPTGAKKMASIMDSMGNISGLGDMTSKLGTAGLVIGGAWLVGSMMGTPTTKRNIQAAPPDQAPSSDGEYINPDIYAGAPLGAGPPTARLVQNGTGYQRMKININGNAMNGMSNEEIAGIVSQEIQAQTGIPMNINVTSKDDRTTIDKQWIEDQFTRAMETGFSY